MNRQKQNKQDSNNPLPRFQQVQRAFTSNIRDPDNTSTPEGIEERRMAIYRELVYNNIEDLLSNFFPVLNEILPDQRWHAIIREFIAKHKSKTPIFMELAREFLEFLNYELEHADVDPDFLLELAHYEWLEIALHTMKDDISSENVDVNGNLLEGSPVLTSLVHFACYRYPVHKISPEYLPDKPQTAYLLVYRDRNDEVQFMETNQMAARLLELIRSNQERDSGLTGRQLLTQIAKELQHTADEVVISGGQQIMQEWYSRDILLGTRQQ